MVVGIAELPPSPDGDDALSLHRHAEAEVYHILAGSEVVIINTEEYPVSAGATVFIPGNAGHGVRNTGTGPLRLLWWPYQTQRHSNQQPHAMLSQDSERTRQRHIQEL